VTLTFALVKEDWIVTDFLDEKRQEITNRLAELGPLVEEYRRLEAAASALDGIGGGSTAATATAAPRRRGPGRPPGSGKKAAAAAPAKKRGRPPGRPKKVGRPKGKKVGRPAGSTNKAAATAAPAAASETAAPAKRRAGRRKGSGTRAAQALSFVQGQPGITIPELAAKMGIKQNYLYRVLPGLEQEGKLSKQGRGWHPKG
jgi:hypothetical protein